MSAAPPPPPPPGSPSQGIPPAGPGGQPRRDPLIIGGVALVVTLLVVIVILLLNRGDDGEVVLEDPSATPTPTLTATPTPTPTPVPTATSTPTPAPAPTPTPVPTPTATPPEPPVPTEPTAQPAPTPTEAPTSTEDINGPTRERYAAAIALWETVAGEVYDWEYEEVGEGMETIICVTGTAGDDAATQNVVDCPNGLSVDTEPRGMDFWLEHIEAILAAPPSPNGQTVDATFDEVTGHILNAAFAGGERDSLTISTLEFTISGQEG